MLDTADTVPHFVVHNDTASLHMRVLTVTYSCNYIVYTYIFSEIIYRATQIFICDICINHFTKANLNKRPWTYVDTILKINKNSVLSETRNILSVNLYFYGNFLTQPHFWSCLYIRKTVSLIVILTSWFVVTSDIVLNVWYISIPEMSAKTVQRNT